MAETRFYGPPAGGAGVGVRITDNSPSGRQGALGINVLVAPFTRGAGSVAERVLDVDRFNSVNGAVLTTDYSGQFAHAFFGRAKGFGELHTLRVVHDWGQGDDFGKATLLGYAREVDPNIQTVFPKASSAERKVSLTARALSTGDWGGPKFQYAGFVDDSTISGATIRLDTDQNSVFQENELVGAKFKIGTFGTEFTVLANEASNASGPMLTLDQGFSGYTPVSGSVMCRIYRGALDDDGNQMGCSVSFGDDGARPNSRMAANVNVNGNFKRRFQDWLLSDTEAIVDDLVAAIETGYQDVEFHFTGQTVSDDTVPEARPCNWAGMVKPNVSGLAAELDKALVTNGQVSLDITEFILVDANGGNSPQLSALPTIPTTAIPHVYDVTFTSATDFTVTVVDPYTGATIVQAADMPAGTTGTAYPGAGLPHPGLVTFTVEADAGLVSGCNFKLFIWALPEGLKDRGAYLYPAAWSGTGRAAVSSDPGSEVARPGALSRFQVVGNGVDWVKLAKVGNTEAGDVLQPPKPPVARGTDTSNSHDTNTAALTFIYNIEVDGVALYGSDVTLTMGTGTVTDTTAEVAALLETADNATNSELRFSADSQGRLEVWLSNGYAGSNVELAVKNGTVNAAVGLTDATDHAGKDGAVCRLEFNQDLQGGRREHGQVSLSDLQDVFTLDVNAPLRKFVEEQAGLVTVNVPGITDPTTLNLISQWCDTVGCFPRFDMPNNLADELAAADWLQTQMTANRFMGFAYPSWGKASASPRVANGRETVPLSGSIAGAEAAKLNDPNGGRGWHKAIAGTDVLLSPDIRSLVRDAGASLSVADILSTPKTRDEILNPAGIVPVVKSGASVYLFGGEGPNANNAGTYWLHKWKAVLHIMAIFRGNFSEFLYQVQNPSLRRDLAVTVRSLLEPLHEQGWFKTLEPGLPDVFQNCVSVQCDEANNPNPETGQLICSVKFFIVDTTKQVIFDIGTGGISVAGAL